jgi:hypothetical protein
MVPLSSPMPRLALEHLPPMPRKVGRLRLPVRMLRIADRIPPAYRPGLPGCVLGAPRASSDTNFGGSHTPHGEYRPATWPRGVAVELLASARQPARWYFVPVFVT